MTWPFGDLRPLFTSERALEIGKAAEHLVCADLILSGYRAFLSDQGLPYDLVVDLDGRLIRIQVKSTGFAKNVNARGRNERVAYGWAIRARGKGRKGERLNETHCDVVALVALDIRVVAYVPLRVCGQTMQLLPPGSQLKTQYTRGSQWARTIDRFPFSEAVTGDVSTYKAALRQLTHCIHGHEYTPENTRITVAGTRVCRECAAIHSSKQYAARVEAGNARH